jgi:nitrogenase molybdenum-iron protein alpha chain
MPIGKKATREWLTDVAAHFGLEKEAGRIADEEERSLNEAIGPLLSQVRGKRVMLCGGVVRVGVEALTLEELGLDVIGIRAYHYDDGAEPIYSEVAGAFADKPVVVSNQLFELSNQIRTYKPDLMVSHSGTHGTIAKLGVPSVQLFNTEKAFFGYGGLYAILRSIAFALKNKSYQERLSKHVTLPYRDDWFEKDPFYYVKNGVSRKE